MSGEPCRKKRFSFHCLNQPAKTLKAGDEGNDVRQLQTFLTQMGYLGRNREPGKMCGCTRGALRYFQKCYGIKDSGEACEATLNLIQRPRCGVPDILADSTRESGASAFTLVGCKYRTNELTYAFANGTTDLAATREQEIITEAFQVWAAVTPLSFTQVAPGDRPTFLVSWERLDHGDGNSFDDSGSISGNTLAHCFFPPPCGGINAGALHFDEFERWVDGSTPGGIRLLNVAIHEIGHGIGLKHSNVSGAIMFPFYDDDVDTLQPDDIEGIQAIYGKPNQARRTVGPARVPIRGRLNGAGDRKLHSIDVGTGRLNVVLTGPKDADFDLYLRAGLEPTRQRFDVRGFGSTANEEVNLDVTGGEIFILVDSWSGSGEYEVTVNIS